MPLKYYNRLTSSVQGCNARKVNCGCVYSVYILKPVLWAEFVNSRCISVHLVSEEVKSIKLIILINHIIISYDQNNSLIFYVKDGSHVRPRHPSCVYISAQRQYTAVQKMCTLLKYLSLPYINSKPPLLI